MNKRNFLKNLGLIAFGLPFLSFGRQDLPKLGYIDIYNLPEGTGCCHWEVYSGDVCLSNKKTIQIANDIEGYYDVFIRYIDVNNGIAEYVREYDKNIRFVYRGELERYKKFV